MFLNQKGQTFKMAMPLAMHNLAIAQQRNVERYRHVRGGGWDRPKTTFTPRDYVMLKQETKHTLKPPAYPHVLRILEMRPSGVVVLEGSNAARCSRQLKDVAHCPLPIVDTRLYRGRYYWGPSVHCQVCERRGDGPKTVLCNKCKEGYHLWCMDTPLMAMPSVLGLY